MNWRNLFKKIDDLTLLQFLLLGLHFSSFHTTQENASSVRSLLHSELKLFTTKVTTNSSPIIQTWMTEEALRTTEQVLKFFVDILYKADTWRKKYLLRAKSTPETTGSAEKVR